MKEILLEELNKFIERKRKKYLSKIKAYECIRDSIAEDRADLPVMLHNLEIMLYVDDIVLYNKLAKEINNLRRDSKWKNRLPMRHG